MGTPLQTRTLTVPAGTTGVIEPTPGRHVKIVSCTVASVLLGFDGLSPQRAFQGDCYAGPDGGFQSIRLFDDVGACTVEVQISDQPISGSDGSTAAAILTQLTAINQEISGGIGTLLADTVCAVTGGAGTPLFAANPNRALVEIQADLLNGAERIYLGRTAAVSAVNKFYTLAAGDPWWDEREKGAIFAVSDLGTGLVCGREI